MTKLLQFGYQVRNGKWVKESLRKSPSSGKEEQRKGVLGRKENVPDSTII